jgi:hypothetical protein
VLEPVVAPAFQGLLGYEGYRAKQEEDEEWGLYVEDHAPIHGTKKALVKNRNSVTRVAVFFARPKFYQKCLVHIKTTYQTTV